MKLVQTMVIRDEIDVIDAQIAHHLNAGVDFVIAIDHNSRDGTSEVLEAYARDGHLLRIPRTGTMQESAWRTHLARLAAVEHGADWVFNADGDEFYWPRGGGFKEVFTAIPERYGYVLAPSRVFVPVFDGEAFFAERMTLRLTAHAPINDPVSVYRPYAKVVHRARPGVVIGGGNHFLVAGDLRPMTGWSPIEVLHFPLRSREQVEKKQLAWNRDLGHRTWGSYQRAGRLHASGRLADYIAGVAVDASAIVAGLESRQLTRDTRLRDVLRELLGGSGETQQPSSSRPQLHRRRVRLPVVADDVEYAVDLAARAAAELVRISRDVDVLEARLATRERARSDRRRGEG